MVTRDLAQLEREQAPSAETKAEAPSPELAEARRRLEVARERLISAAVAFCDGAISAGQLKAVREFLREQTLQIDRLSQKPTPPFAPPSPAQEPQTLPPPKPAPEPTEAFETVLPEAGLEPEIASRLRLLNRKLSRLESDYAQGRINSSQYQAIRRHYAQQREIALNLHRANPQSDRWRVVLEEGKTSFLLQLNEAVCCGFAIYDAATRKRIFLQGSLHPSAEEAMPLLGTFGSPTHVPGSTRMLATQTEDGHALLLIPGTHTTALVMFSQDPPGWQVRAVHEVHRNFEAANTAALVRGERRALLFPDVSRIVKG